MNYLKQQSYCFLYRVIRQYCLVLCFEIQSVGLSLSPKYVDSSWMNCCATSSASLLLFCCLWSVKVQLNNHLCACYCLETSAEIVQRWEEGQIRWRRGGLRFGVPMLSYLYICFSLCYCIVVNPSHLQHHFPVRFFSQCRVTSWLWELFFFKRMWSLHWNTDKYTPGVCNTNNAYFIYIWQVLAKAKRVLIVTLESTMWKVIYTFTSAKLHFKKLKL